MARKGIEGEEGEIWVHSSQLFSTMVVPSYINILLKTSICSFKLHYSPTTTATTTTTTPMWDMPCYMVVVGPPWSPLRTQETIIACNRRPRKRQPATKLASKINMTKKKIWSKTEARKMNKMNIKDHSPPAPLKGVGGLCFFDGERSHFHAFPPPFPVIIFLFTSTLSRLFHGNSVKSHTEIW